ncbi:MAG: Rrf2 family transcriptional regulator [Planctomycetes bacterium]|nr:Rrf2 family transcriptional regulator [Planctomycetota bacterium]
MRLSTKARYGVRALLELALAHGRGPVQLRRIAEKQGISPKYLEHLLSSLRAAGIVTAVRGMNGGYELTRAPSEIRLIDAYRALEGPVAPVPCSEDPSLCEKSEKCAVHEVWVEMREAIETILEKKTLADLAERARANGEDGASGMYFI